MRAKRHTFFAHLCEITKTENLKAAGIGQERSVPAHEFVQTTQRADQLMSRTQVKMIGVPQNDVGIQFLEHILGHSFDRTNGSHRHKRWRFQRAVRGLYAAEPRCASLSFNGERKSHEQYGTR